MRALLILALFIAALPAQTEYAQALREADRQLADGNFDQVIATLRDWPSRLPDRPEANHFLGLAFYRLANYRAAIYHLSAALKHEQENSESWKQATEILGASYYFSNNWTKAAPFLERAAAWQPANSDLQYTLAMSYLFTGNTEGARKSFAKIYGVDPESPQAYLVLVDMLRKENVEAGIEQLLKEVREKWPHTPGIAYRLGVVATKSGKHEQAAALFREELKSNPGDSKTWQALGESLVSQQNPAEAAEALKRAIWLDAGAASSYAMLAKLYMDASNYGLAEDTLRQALKINPQSYEANFLLGRLYHKTGRAEQAKKQLEQADKIPH